MAENSPSTCLTSEMCEVLPWAAGAVGAAAQAPPGWGPWGHLHETLLHSQLLWVTALPKSSHCCLQGENSVKLEAGSAQLSLCGLGVQHRKVSLDPFLNACIPFKSLMSHCGSGGGVIHVSTGLAQ